MAFTASTLKLTGFDGSIGTAQLRTWTYTTAGSATAYRAAGYFNTKGASSGDSEMLVNDLVLVKSSVSGVSWNYVSDAGTGTIAATV